MKINLLRLEKYGVLPVMAFAALLSTLRCLSDSGIICIFFGAVNDSIYEHCKLLLLSYLCWGVLELLCVKPSFKRFMAAKIISLYILGILYILLCLAISAVCGELDSLAGLLAGVVSVAAAFWASHSLYGGAYEIQRLFLPCFFLFLLFVALYSTLTVFAPHLSIFLDRASGMYGIVPEYIDMGAAALERAYNVR